MGVGVIPSWSPWEFSLPFLGLAVACHGIYHDVYGIRKGEWHFIGIVFPRGSILGGGGGGSPGGLDLEPPVS